MLRNDQLRREMESKNVLTGFQETPPKFPPTFKVTPGQYLKYISNRTPSYCDRILHTSSERTTHLITQDNFESVNTVLTSDHKVSNFSHQINDCSKKKKQTSDFNYMVFKNKMMDES